MKIKDISEEHALRIGKIIAFSIMKPSSVRIVEKDPDGVVVTKSDDSLYTVHVPFSGVTVDIFEEFDFLARYDIQPHVMMSISPKIILEVYKYLLSIGVDEDCFKLS